MNIQDRNFSSVSETETARLKALDFEHVWHPFTQASVWLEEDNPLIVEKASGVKLYDIEGQEYLDGVSSLWCNVHGHAVPELLEALEEQARKVCHSTLLGLTHRPILELTERLFKIVPSNLNRVFYADSGSTAVEAGLRICLEWWQKQGQVTKRKKRRLLSLETGYHGDTLGAVGVGYVESFHRSLEANVIPALRVPQPHMFRFYEGLSPEDSLSKSIEVLERVFRTRSDEIAAFVIEPLVQGAAGIWPYPAQYLRRVSELCREYDVLLMVDEVATGFGKTGKMFATELAGGDVQPDVMIVGKGLAAGYLPISAALTTERLFQGFVAPPEELKTFFYGQTFAGNPLAAAVACRNLDLFRSSHLLEKLPERIAHLHRELQEKIEPLTHVDEIRTQGVMIGIELTKTPGKREAYPTAEQAGIRITRAARRLGAVIRPLGNVIVLMPPLAMTEKDLSKLIDITQSAIVETLGE